MNEWEQRISEWAYLYKELSDDHAQLVALVMKLPRVDGAITVGPAASSDGWDNCVWEELGGMVRILANCPDKETADALAAILQARQALE